MHNVSEKDDEIVNKEYPEGVVDGIRIKVRNTEVVIDSKIAIYLGNSKDEIKTLFLDICTKLQDTCQEYSLSYKDVIVHIAANDKISRSLSDKHERKAIGGDLIKLISIPKDDFSLLTKYFIFDALHELGHCWIDIKYPADIFGLEVYEAFIDLVAIYTFKKIILEQEEIYRNVVKKRSYIGGDQKRSYIKPWFPCREPEPFNQDALINPEPFLKEMSEQLKKNGNIIGALPASLFIKKATVK